MFNEIDQNNTGQISERDFCEYYVHYKTGHSDVFGPLFKKGQYQYASTYNRNQNFISPTNIDPKMAPDYNFASPIFRKYDNGSGYLNRKEFKKAYIEATGHQGFAKGENKRIFHEIDTDNSGRISEREFCEYFVQRKGMGYYGQAAKTKLVN